MQAWLGITFIIGLCFMLSSHKRKVQWMTIGLCLVCQFVFAFLVLKVPGFVSVFNWMSSFFVKVLDFTTEGSVFLFGQMMDVKSFGFIFAFQVLPTIVFFSALTSLLYYLGILQWIVYGFAWFFSKTMKMTGAESLSTAGNIFLGQTEAPLLIKPFIPNMSRSEILCIMVGGMANIAGGVLAAYVGFLGGEDPVARQQFATHLLCASIMSAPAAILVSKLLEPEENPETLDRKVTRLERPQGQHFFEAITNGTTEGVLLAVNVGAMLLVFTAFMAMANSIVSGLGSVTGLNAWITSMTQGQVTQVSLQYLLGLAFSPIAWLIGVNSADLQIAGQLLGAKTILNEFYAYGQLGQVKDQFASPQSLVIITYALCGFANFSSIGIQIGGIGAMAPNQKRTLASLGLKALVGGTCSTMMTASIVSFFI